MRARSEAGAGKRQKRRGEEREKGETRPKRKGKEEGEKGEIK